MLTEFLKTVETGWDPHLIKEAGFAFHEQCFRKKTHIQSMLLTEELRLMQFVNCMIRLTFHELFVPYVLSDNTFLHSLFRLFQLSVEVTEEATWGIATTPGWDASLSQVTSLRLPQQSFILLG